MRFSLRLLSGEVSQSQFQALRLTPELKACLARHRAEGIPVYCLCPGGDRPPLPLSVVLRDAYHLRCYKFTSHQHHADCVFFEEQRAPGQARYVPGVVRNEDDFLSVTLDDDAFPLQSENRAAHAQVAAIDDEFAKPPRGQSRGSVRLLGLFRLLLEEAQVTSWRPAFAGKRSASWLLFRLNRRAEMFKIPAADAYLSDMILWLNRPHTIAELIEHFRSRFAFQLGVDSEILVIGQLLSARPSSTGKSVLLSFAGLAPFVLASPDFWTSILRRRGPALQFTDSEPTYPTIALFTVRTQLHQADGGKAPFLHLTSLAPVIFSRELLPVESGYEATFADYLCSEGRSFEKPVRCSSEDEVFPDFILTDTSPPSYVEVWGRKDPHYLTRKTAKRARYLSSSTPLIEWSQPWASTLPSLPPSTL